jgi:hypothetical protein
MEWKAKTAVRTLDILETVFSITSNRIFLKLIRQLKSLVDTARTEGWEQGWEVGEVEGRRAAKAKEEKQ